MNGRRSLLASVAGAAAAGANAQDGGAQLGHLHLDAELLAACERHPALLAAFQVELNTTHGDGGGPAGAAYDANCGVISAAEPRTWQGVLAMARAVRHEGTLRDGSQARQDFCSIASAWSWGVMEGVLRLAGEGA